ncbi:bifunctional oligoribonuclease/PAP phosphatase NrnA [bacterium]|nr:bifunctional oligoribonuclease/PAP phosphatase NrnA [bacterium]
MPLSDVAQALNTHQRFLVTTHQNPDGDAVGSLLAMAHLLRADLEKYVVAVLPDPLTKRYQFLPGLDTLVTPAEAAEMGPYDAIITVDVSTPTRIGKVYELITDSMTRINIDHHVTNPRTDDFVWVEPEASATCEMMVDLYEELDVTPTRDAATAMYTGIITDTGQFAFKGTTAKAICAASKLVEWGAEFERVAYEVYHKTDAAMVRTLGNVLNRMELHDEDRIAITWMEREELPVDHEGFVNHLLDIETVEVAALLRPLDTGQWKVSLRSAGLVDVTFIAKQIDGGGHSMAAGGTLPATDAGPAKQRVTELCLAALQNAREAGAARA